MRSNEARHEAVMQAEDLVGRVAPVRSIRPDTLPFALIDSLDDAALARLAERLAPYLPSPAPPDEWLDAPGAAAYLSVPKSTLHKLTAENAIPFEQDGPGCKLYFKRSALDAWRKR
jgi:excisionase family DNA binding protein